MNPVIQMISGEACDGWSGSEFCRHSHTIVCFGRVFAMTGKAKKTLLGQLTQRKVTRVALAYVVVGWFAMQVGEVTFEAVRLPDWALTLLIVFIVIGFPIALVIAWAYEVTPQGIRKDDNGLVSAAKDGADYLADSKFSIAVLPFYDMSEYGDQDRFCEGLSEEILNALCKVKHLDVASRIASFQCGHEEGVDAVEIGKRLRVKTVLEGTVRKYGDKFRITVELVDTVNGYHLWSRQYDCKVCDVFDIQEDVAESVANVLSLSVVKNKKFAKHKVNPKAYKLLLSGMSLFSRRTMKDVLGARKMFNAAIEIDPQFGRAWAGLAATYGFEYMGFNASEVNKKEAMRASTKALEYAPERAESHVLAGLANCMFRNYGTAEKEFRKAIDLKPGNFEAHYFMGRTKVREGEFEEALKYFGQAAKIKPEDYESVLLQAQLYVSLGDQKRARDISQIGIERVRRSLKMNPQDNRALNIGALALLRLGEEEEARRWMTKSIDNAPDDSIVNYRAACFYALLNETEKALDCLENCTVKVGHINKDWLANDSDLANIREHPRFAGIVAAVSDREQDSGHNEPRS